VENRCFGGLLLLMAPSQADFPRLWPPKKKERASLWARSPASTPRKPEARPVAPPPRWPAASSWPQP